ncbi:MAG TPA: exodeoxyribonuclease V subunit gamma [Egibacteraceae bacterium]|nr:exodeoxyribonuclease V subunit gamma [Egibacteraceae bacterium]
MSTLRIHRAERADRLVDALAGVLAEAPPDPFTPDLVAVPTRGIERWLAQELSLRLGAGGGLDGVCANVEFPFPATVVGRALAVAGAVGADADPWVPSRLVWPLLEVIDAHLGEEWLGPLRTHLGGRPNDADPTRRNRRFAAARHIADLFDRYAVHRPRMLCAWAEDRDVDADGAALDADAVWQAHLWRLVRRRLPAASPAERLAQAAAALAAGTRVPDLPDRIAVFGLTALPASYLRVLGALAAHEVHLFLLHPSPALWAAVAATLGGAPRPVVRRDEDPTSGLARNPLLASWGRDAREMQLVVSSGPAPVDDHLPAGRTPPGTLLARLQADVRADRPPPGRPVAGADDARALLEPGDRSVQVHACHGRTRQVEVLRDAILHLLADDSELEPRDIVVMCPDIEAYAPIVQAVFGVPPAAGDRAGTPRLPDVRVKLADRAIRQTNPLLRVVADVLDRADGRLTASEVLDLASREPVRRRFGFDDAALTRLETWVAAAQVRWGLHAGHRAAFDLGGVEANTWRAGLNRILLGVTTADDGGRLVEGTAPLDDVEGTEVDLAGRLAELVDRLDEAVTALQGPQTVDQWAAALALTANLLAATAEADRWQRLQLDRLLDDLRGQSAGSEVALALPEARVLLGDRLQGRPSRANHRTGDLTVCTLVPMRSVPHRVVCLLGMDDGAFPRRTVPDGDDLLDRTPRVGDRDLRTEDRQLLLDALLAAGDALVVTYTGRDERTNDQRPPAVPVGELLDTIDATVRTGDGKAASERVGVDHPLQPFDARNFTPGALGRAGPWGFDHVSLAGARARAVGATPERGFLEGPLEGWEPARTLELDELVTFLGNPVKAFLRRRLDISLPRAGDEPSDAIPVELSPLERHGVGERLLTARLAGVDEAAWTAAELARGVLPPGALADRALAPIRADVDAIIEAARAAVAERAGDRGAAVGVLPVHVALPGGRTLVGTVAGVHGQVILAVQYARLGPKHRLAAWARLLAATAAAPDRAFCAVTVGRAASGRGKQLVAVSRLGPLGEDATERRDLALAELARLADIYDRGMREPLPVYCATSAAYAEIAGKGEDPRAAASRWYTSQPTFAREDREPAHRLVLGGVRPFDELLAEGPRPDECGDGWFDEEPSRLGRHARRLWSGLLAVEELGPP